MRPRQRILVVEDDLQLAQLYCLALSLRGIDCVRARDGDAALRSVEQERPAAILLDMNLPTVNGWVVLDELAANPLTNGIPVIVVTGIEPTPRVPHALVVLCKPCDPEHVANIVVDHLPAAAASQVKEAPRRRGSDPPDERQRVCCDR